MLPCLACSATRAVTLSIRELGISKHEMGAWQALGLQMYSLVLRYCEGLPRARENDAACVPRDFAGLLHTGEDVFVICPTSLVPICIILAFRRPGLLASIEEEINNGESLCNEFRCQMWGGCITRTTFTVGLEVHQSCAQSLSVR